MGPRRSAGGGSGCSSRVRAARHGSPTQVSTPSTAHKHGTHTCAHPDGTDVRASGGMFGRVRREGKAVDL
eukprot:1050367-Prymnesium_polylepis.1